jgi:hypothetical protein
MPSKPSHTFFYFYTKACAMDIGKGWCPLDINLGTCICVHNAKWHIFQAKRIHGWMWNCHTQLTKNDPIWSYINICM